MSDENNTNPDELKVYETAQVVQSQMESLETFIARRFDEISMEINASAQQADMAEDTISENFSKILEVIGAINYKGEGNTAANTGVELEAIIKDTETAANNILDATDKIVDHIMDDSHWDSEDAIANTRKIINDDVQNIVMACSFQDLTGQRVRNTLDDLNDIEDRLSSTLENLGINVDVDKNKVDHKTADGVKQGDVDSLFDGDADTSSEEDKSSSQDDIDSLFG